MGIKSHFLSFLHENPMKIIKKAKTKLNLITSNKIKKIEKKQEIRADFQCFLKKH